MPDLSLEVATPEKLLVNERVSEVTIPGKDGYFGVLPGAAPLISELTHGVLTYVNQSGPHHIALLAGFAEVLDDKVKILADDARVKADINLEQARADLQKANELLNRPSEIDPAQSLSDALRAQALIDTATK
jgi:F-type H+-transporting ATPase subunit epsilon